jgi:branched-chain amino acid transport system substrate-binding protein
VSRARKAIGGVSAVALLLAFLGAATVPAGSVVRSVRGFDGKTITVAGIGSAASGFAESDVGTLARLKRANDTNELKGIKFEYKGFADDKQDVATATSEVRRLVEQEGVFAIVPDLSAINPGPYLNAKHVPYIGWAFDNTYCSDTPTTKLYGFGFNGCLVPADPPFMPGGGYQTFYQYLSKKTGKKHPSIVLFSQDNQSGKHTAELQAVPARGVGLDVVYNKGVVPLQVSDYTPYVQQWLKADGGKQPDAINCLLATQCLPIWSAVKAAGYTGTFITSIYTDVLLKPLAGTVSYVSYNIEPNAGLTQLKKDLDAEKPGTQVTSSNAVAYFAADMLIQALKKVGKNITPEAVQKVLATQTWQIKGFVGPLKYPASTVVPQPFCQTVVEDADGTSWKAVVPFTCSTKTFKVKSTG